MFYALLIMSVATKDIVAYCHSFIKLNCHTRIKKFSIRDAYSASILLTVDGKERREQQWLR